MQLFGCSDVSGDPPEPKASWRDDCSCVLHKEVSYSLKPLFPLLVVYKKLSLIASSCNLLFNLS